MFLFSLGVASIYTIISFSFSDSLCPISWIILCFPSVSITMSAVASYFFEFHHFFVRRSMVCFKMLLSSQIVTWIPSFLLIFLIFFSKCKCSRSAVKSNFLSSIISLLIGELIQYAPFIPNSPKTSPCSIVHYFPFLSKQ